ncbi:ABC transporter permease [Martelella limonii]|uniref:ABC transporter permease n=1 Tax=Martelella limonii TaxID=1647649 RepID=UPI0015808E78|nr:ABC transporter permease [Martelella limonii]
MSVTGIFNRAVMAAVTLFGVAVIVFCLLRVVPGDPIAMMISPGASADDILALKVKYGLDSSIPVQFGVWIREMLTGDFGTSISLKRPVLSLLMERLPATLELAFAALVFGVIGGGLIAILATLARRTALESIIDVLNGLFLAVPDFVWALLFVLVLGVAFPVFPTSGRVDPQLSGDFSTNFYLVESLVTLRFSLFANVLSHMVMPVLALGLPLAAVIIRTLKEALSEAMLQDYVLLARLKGMSETRLVVQETLRNAIGPTLTLTGVQFTFMIGGTVIVERIFSYPGIGNMAIDAVINRDLPLIQGIVLMFGLIFVLINIAIDLAGNFFNPRLRHG